MAESKFEDIPDNIGNFAVALRSLYVCSYTRMKDTTKREIEQIRDETKREVTAYMEDVLLGCDSVVRSIREIFENYETLKFEDWIDYYDHILKNVERAQKSCQTIISKHEMIMAPFYQKQDKATAMANELTQLSVENHNILAEREAMADDQAYWMKRVLVVPFAGLIAAAVLGVKKNANLENATELRRNIQFDNNAVDIIEKSVIPSLKNLIACLTAISGFFNVMKCELKGYHNTAKTLQAKHAPLPDDITKLTTYFKLMKLKSTKIITICEKYNNLMPNARSQLLAITSYE